MDIKDLAGQLNLLSSEDWKELSRIMEEEYGIYLTGSIVKSEPVMEPASLGFFSAYPGATMDNHNRFGVYLKHWGLSKLNVVKKVKEELVMTLYDAKVLVDSAPVYLKENTNRDDAVNLVITLKDLGAEVKLVETPI